MTESTALQSRPRVLRAPTPTALVVVNGDDVYEDLFAASLELQQLLGAAGFACRVGMGMARFATDIPLEAGVGDADLVVLYTATGTFTKGQQDGLANLVDAGTGLLAIHASNVFPDGDAGVIEALLGSRYGSHGPQPHESRFTVRLTQEHEITRGLDDFAITHEHYAMQVADDLDVIAWRDTASGREPLLHVREIGAGRAAYLQLGHDLRALGEPTVRELIRRTALWARRTRKETA